MRISYSKNFIKQSKKLTISQREKVRQRIRLFIKDPLHPSLRNHALKGKYKDYCSINITGDIRALYLKHKNEIIFDTIGTHSQLYG